MIHRSNCGCAGCVRNVLHAKWMASHKYGDIHMVVRRSLAPTDARELAAALNSLAIDADNWRESQLESAGIEEAATTKRSAGQGDTEP